MLVATLVSLLGILLAYLMYGKRSIDRDWLSSRVPMTYSILYNKYFIDEFYERSFVYGAKAVSLFLRFIEVFLVEGLIKVIIGFVQGLGRSGAKVQSGQIQTYGMAAFLGLAFLMLIFAITGGYL
jgi:NADH-quinone oxidoreductase subunit L